MIVRDTKATAELLKALAHPTRLLILEELLAGPKCVTDIEDLLSVRQANVSQHLTVLRHAQLVDFAQSGALRCYYLARPKLVRDLLRLTQRGDPVLRRTVAEIQAEKARIARKSRREKSYAAPARRRVKV
jgi:ArsR family transcriptional regulator